MLIKLKNGTTFSSDKIINVKKEAPDSHSLKLNNGYTTMINSHEYSWLMTIVGNMVEINENIAINVNCITIFELIDEVYSIGWDGEPPIKLSKKQGDDLMGYVIQSGFKPCMKLEDRISELQSLNTQINYKKI